MKIICIGRNYAEHAKELGNAVPESPLIFIKPSSAMVVNSKPVYYPDFTKNLHFECEVVLKIGKNGKHISEENALSYCSELSLGIDFTARDLQDELKKKGHPWEIAKGFDSSAPVGEFVPMSEVLNPEGNIEFSLLLNGKTAQVGNTRDLIFSFETLISYCSKFFTLHKGDLIFTGTPAGVGPVAIGDLLEGYLGSRKVLEVEIK